MRSRVCLLVVAICLTLTVAAPPTDARQASKTPANPSTSQEVGLAKKLLAARRDYQAALEQLRGYYASVGDNDRLRWSEDELRQFHRVTKYAYVMDLDVAGPNLQPLQNVPAANDLYRRALSYKDRGFGSDYTDNQIRAELLFQQLLQQYPTCNKISDAAYQLGELYESRAFNQPGRAAVYFERSAQWNPNTQLDARLRAARIYDRTLGERSKAIGLYRQVLNQETDPKRIQEAQQRLQALGSNP